ncbi:MAG: hypothetical protein LKH93_06340 [Clostridium beijerinckii]|jgi:hypothetical protein|uniref:hypothetical protein n=1 Tax=Clostridium beijerinckii TaxID=1520 RepID=UPI001F45E36D|nr:hypothetical protein [Clostridium beijerinckii]MCI1578816.1 hypothetical protein [Clostridium beijerinckii]MCI1583857.1 hypothetical protein [Clostridium beijerinckii]MCI1621825.1 hypothetical protein [Clostridium beijerinckii]
MNEKEFIDIKNQIIGSINIQGEYLEIYDEILDSCLEGESTDTNLAINLKGSKGSLKRYKIKFNLIVAIQLLQVGVGSNDGGLNLKNGILFILGIISALASYDNVSLEPMQAQIIYILYGIHERGEMNPSEEELFELLHDKSYNITLSLNKFHMEVEKLLELKCIDIKEGKIELIEKVRF